MVKEKSSVRTYKKEETNLPEWFNKEIKEEKNSKEEEEEIKNLFKNFI